MMVRSGEKISMIRIIIQWLYDLCYKKEINYIEVNQQCVNHSEKNKSNKPSSWIQHRWDSPQFSFPPPQLPLDPGYSYYTVDGCDIV